MTVQDESATSTATHGATLTDATAAKAKALLDQEGRDDLALCIAVQPGGCAGLRYNLFFDDRSLDGDAQRQVVTTLLIQQRLRLGGGGVGQDCAVGGGRRLVLNSHYFSPVHVRG